MIGALCSTADPNEKTSPHSDGDSPWSLSHWSVDIGYRYQHSFRHFVGTTEQTQRAMQHTQVVNYLNLFDVSVNYHFTPRWSVSLSLPIMNATRTYDHQLFQTLLHIPNAPDQVTHANGIGDIGVSAQFWLHRPPAEKGHNIAFSFGTVFPTGSSDVRDTVETVNGPQRVFVDQSIQLGAGGYGITLGTQDSALCSLCLGNLPVNSTTNEWNSEQITCRVKPPRRPLDGDDVHPRPVFGRWWRGPSRG